MAEPERNGARTAVGCGSNPWRGLAIANHRRVAHDPHRQPGVAGARNLYRDGSAAFEPGDLDDGLVDERDQATAFVFDFRFTSEGYREKDLGIDNRPNHGLRALAVRSRRYTTEAGNEILDRKTGHRWRIRDDLATTFTSAQTWINGLGAGRRMPTEAELRAVFEKDAGISRVSLGGALPGSIGLDPSCTRNEGPRVRIVPPRANTFGDAFFFGRWEGGTAQTYGNDSYYARAFGIRTGG